MHIQGVPVLKVSDPKPKKGGWVKTILEKSPFIEKIVQAFLGVSDLFLTRYVCNFYYHVH